MTYPPKQRRRPPLPCSNCERADIIAKGLCTRCYSYRKRHGALPPKTWLIANAAVSRPHKLPVTMTRELFSAVRHAARSEQMPVTLWVRRLLLERVGVSEPIGVRNRRHPRPVASDAMNATQLTESAAGVADHQ